MILEFLKLRSLVTDALVARAEQALVKRVERRERIDRQIALVSSAAPQEVSVPDIRTMLDTDGAATLRIDGREITIRSERGELQAALGPAAEAKAAEPAEVVVETLAAPEITNELMAEVDGALTGILFTAEEVEDILRTANQPKKTIVVAAEELPSLSDTMTLAKLEVFREGEDEPVLRGTFISATLFGGCDKPDCEACVPGEDGEEAVILHLVPDGEKDRSIISSELVPGTRVALSI